MAERRRRWLAALVGLWLALVIVAVFVGVANERDALSTNATAALAGAGIDAAVAVDGRDVTVDVTPGDQPAVLAALAGVRGIRTVDFHVVRLPEPPAAPAPSTTTSSSVPAAPPPRLVATLHEGTIHLAGLLPSPEIVASIDSVARLIYAPLVDGLPTVGETAAGSWFGGAARAVAVLPIVPEAELVVTGEHAVLRGSAPTAARRAKLAAAVAAALGPEVELEDRVTMNGLRPPTFHAEAPGDGTFTISGTVPSRDIAAALHDAAARAFGEGRVVDRIVIDRAVDASFSLYRLPFVIPQLAAIPQWTLDIDDDVITGSLRGGATFPSGSAELSPQLRGLLDVAAGILARNPTLGIVIAGHTDSIGSKAANQALSERRAGNAKAYLVAAGIDERRIMAVGYGEEHPIATNRTREGRARNRRVEFRFGPVERLQGGDR